MSHSAGRGHISSKTDNSPLAALFSGYTISATFWLIFVTFVAIVLAFWTNLIFYPIIGSRNVR